jgi:uncharacterized protein (TIGR02145 family)
LFNESLFAEDNKTLKGFMACPTSFKLTQAITLLCFSALPGGNRNNNGNFNNVGNNGNWWSATENNSSNAYNRNLNYNNSNMNRNNNNKNNGFSVRCLQNRGVRKGYSKAISTF